jgi:TP901 family phage tail tape measure protein
MSDATLSLIIKAVDNSSGVLGHLKSNLVGVGSSAEEGGKKVGLFGKAFSTMQGVGFAVMGIQGMIAGVQQLGQAITVPIKKAEDFQTALTGLVTGAGEAVGSLGLIRSGVLALAGEVGAAPEKLTHGLYMIESAGFHGAAGLDLLRASAIGAKVGMADQETVANALTSALNSYHLKSSDAVHVTDQLVTAVSIGKMHMQDLASSLGSILPTAAAAHIGLNEVGAAISTMTMQGTSAQEAATHLRMMIGSLEKPSSAAAKALQGIGLTSKEVGKVLTTQGLTPALELIQTHLDKNLPRGSAAANRALMTIFGGVKSGMSAMQLMNGNLSTLEGNLTLMGKASDGAGKTMEGWALAQKDAGVAGDRLSGAMDSIQIIIGTLLLPVLTSAENSLTGLLTIFSDLYNDLTADGGGIGVVADDIREMTGIDIMPIVHGFDAVSEVIGTLISLGSGIVQMFKNGAQGMAGFVQVISVLRSVFPPAVADAIANSIGLIVTAIKDLAKGDLSGMFKMFAKLGDTIGPTLEGLGNYLLGWVGGMVGPLLVKVGTWALAFIEWVGPMIPKVIVEVAKLWLALQRWILGVYISIGTQIFKWGAAFINWIAPMIPPLLAKLNDLITRLWGWVQEQVPLWKAQLLSWGNALWTWIAPYIPIVLGKLNGLAIALWGWVKEQAPLWVAQLRAWGNALWGWIAPYIPIVLGKLGGLATALWGWVKAQAPIWLAQLLSWGNALWGWIAPYIPIVLGKLGGLATSLWNWVKTQTPIWLAQLMAWGNALWGWIQPYIPIVLGKLGGLATSLWAWVKAQAPLWLAHLMTWGAALWSWIQPIIPPLLAKLGELAGRLWTWVKAQVPLWIIQLATWGRAFIAWIAPMIPPFLASLSGLATRFFAWVSAQAAPLLAKLGTWATAFIAWIVPMVTKFLQQWPGMLNKFLDWIGTNAGPILVKLGTWAIAFIKWIAPMIPGFLLALAGIALAIGIFLVETAGTIGLKLLQWGLAFINWIIPRIPGLLLALGQFLIAITGWILLTAMPAIVKQIAGWQDAFVGWIVGLLRKLPGELNKINDSINEWIRGAERTLLVDAEGIGEAIINGIKAGVTKIGHTLITQVTGQVNDTINAAKNLLGIKSPSKVFIEIGANMTLGMIRGLESARSALTDASRMNASIAVNASARVAAFASQRAPTYMSAPSASAQIARVQPTAEVHNHFTLNQTVNGPAPAAVQSFASLKAWAGS